MRRIGHVLMMSLALILGACADPAQDASVTPTGSRPVTTSVGAGAAEEVSDPPEAIRCGTQYRPDASSLMGAEEVVLVAEQSDGIGPVPVRHTFPTMVVEITYVGQAPEGNHVTVRVLGDTGESVLTSLYQFGSGDELRTNFAGGHGFTGLNYVHHGEANLQIWCSAD